jgi:hypothetical protein
MSELVLCQGLGAQDFRCRLVESKLVNSVFRVEGPL